MPLHAERKRRGIRNADRFDGAIFGHTFNDNTLARFENALTMQRIDANGLATKQTRKHAILDQTDIVAICEDHGWIGMDLAILQPRHPVVHPSRQFANLRVQRAAERNIHFLQAAADAEDRHAAGDTGFRE